MHGDDDPDDDLWGNSKWLSDLEEEMYAIDLSAYDGTEGTTHYLQSLKSFTTIGPVVVDHYEIPFHSPANFKLKLHLRNQGLVTTAESITAIVSSSDTNVTGMTNNGQFFGDITAGEVKSSSYETNIYTQNNPHSVKIEVSIKSEGYPYWGDSETINVVLGIEDRTVTIPTAYALRQNYPNPFNPSTKIEFDLPKTSEVTLKIYNILGEEVAMLVSDRLTAGSYSYEWDASNLASGVYLYRLSVGSLSGEAGEFVETRKMVLMR
jgi:hypothetical protein